MQKVRDVDLLALEMDTLWVTDLYGRPPRPHPFLAIAVAKDGQEVRFGPDVPAVARQAILEDDLLHRANPRDLQTPAVLAKYREMLAPPSSARCEGGPSYVFPGEASAIAPTTSLEVITSESPNAMERLLRPEPWWEAKEWADLLAGELGPWAMGVAGERVMAICHTPVASDTAAEAGVWTHPEGRGRGWAGIVTSAWASVAAKRFQFLFYSTSFENRASQAVARKLGLRPLGAIWQIRDDAI